MSKYSHGLRRYSAPWIFCNVEEHACAAPETTGYIEYAHFVSDGVRYEFVAVK